MSASLCPPPSVHAQGTILTFYRLLDNVNSPRPSLCTCKRYSFTFGDVRSRILYRIQSSLASRLTTRFATTISSGFNIACIPLEWLPNVHLIIAVTYTTHFAPFADVATQYPETCPTISSGNFSTRACQNKPLGCFGGDVESIWRWREGRGYFSRVSDTP